MVFPELGLSAYAIDDPLHHAALLMPWKRDRAAHKGQRRPLPALIVGAPMRSQGASITLRRDSCGQRPGGGSEGIPAKLSGVLRAPLVRSRRTSRSWRRTCGLDSPVRHRSPFLFRRDVPFHFPCRDLRDFWVPPPPTTTAAFAGADDPQPVRQQYLVGKAEERRLLCASQTMRCVAAYAYSAAGPGEITTDLAWDGQDLRVGCAPG